MLKTLFIATLLTASAVSTQAHASFMATDWKNTDDRLATLDTRTGLEWLDLTQTMHAGLSMVDVVSLFDTTYAGWRLPTNSEVEQLFNNMWDGFDPYTDRVGPSVLGQSDMGQRNLFYTSLFGDENSVLGFYQGRYFDENGVLRIAGVQVINEMYGHSYFYGLNNSYVYDPTVRPASSGIFLVSDGGTTLSSINDPTININNQNAPINMADVSAPAGLAVFSSMLMLMGFRRKKPTQ